MTYAQIRPHLGTGDIVLFSGAGRLSAWIKAVTGSIWSHVGMVVRDLDADRVWIWESNKKVETGSLDEQLKFEVKPMATWVMQAKAAKPEVSTLAKNPGVGSVAIRHLAVERTPAMLATLTALRDELEGRPFEQDVLQMVRATFGDWFAGWLGNDTEDMSSFFCSELIAETYQRWNLLACDRPSNSFRPKDFSSAGRLPLLGGAALGPEILLVERAE